MTNESIEPAAGEPARTGKNRLGLWGFVCSLLGIVTLGLLSPLAFVLSAVALRRAPRGYAIAGTALGAVGSVLLAGVIVAGYVVVVAAAQVLPELAAASVGLVNPLVQAADAVERHAAAHKGLPDEREGNEIVRPFRDLWGRPLQYVVEGEDFRVTSAGEDGRFNTSDDIAVTVANTERRIVTPGPDGLFHTADDVDSGPFPREVQSAPAAP